MILCHIYYHGLLWNLHNVHQSMCTITIVHHSEFNSIIRLDFLNCLLVIFTSLHVHEIKIKSFV